MPRNYWDGRPVPARSRGPLRDAVRCAFNLVPGPVGPYRVYVQRGAAVLTETYHLAEVPLLAAAPGGCSLSCPSAFRRGRIRPLADVMTRGWPMTRLAAISDMIWRVHKPLYWDTGNGAFMSGSSFTVAGTLFTQARRSWSAEIARTRCGADTSIGTDPGLLWNTIHDLYNLELQWARGVHDAARWAGLTGIVDQLYFAPNIWNSETDPGINDPVGADDGDGDYVPTGQRPQTPAQIWDADMGSRNGPRLIPPVPRGARRDRDGCLHCRDRDCSECEEAGECAECGQELD